MLCRPTKTDHFMIIALYCAMLVGCGSRPTPTQNEPSQPLPPEPVKAEPMASSEDPKTHEQPSGQPNAGADGKTADTPQSLSPGPVKAEPMASSKDPKTHEEASGQTDDKTADTSSPPLTSSSQRVAKNVPETVEDTAPSSESPEPETAEVSQIPGESDEGAAALTKKCTYNTYEWHVRKRKAVGHRRVEKLRSELTDEESDPKDRRCTVCEQDQTTLKIKGIPRVTVCRFYAKRVAKALIAIRDSKEFTIKRLKGYRPGRTRGRVRKNLRTQFSNHSFGTAIDINPDTNGLYTKCRLKKTPEVHKELKTCRLSMFGHWYPKGRPKVTVVSGDIVHRSFTDFWRWGGARKDAIKDFMHFSITGY